MNERITEDIVRDILKANQKKYPKVTIEEQIPENPRIKKLLKHASKQGLGGGSPEFIVTFDEIPDLVIVIECKADITKHESKKRDNPKDFAVDGVLLYSEYLAKEFNVISIAVSGQKSELKISHFLQIQLQPYRDLDTKKMVSFKDYITIYKVQNSGMMLYPLNQDLCAHVQIQFLEKLSANMQSPLRSV